MMLRCQNSFSLTPNNDRRLVQNLNLKRDLHKIEMPFLHRRRSVTTASRHEKVHQKLRIRFKQFVAGHIESGSKARKCYQSQLDRLWLRLSFA